MVDFHLDGDVGIGDLVFASTYWNQERRQWNEYSQYEQNFNAGARRRAGFPGTQEGYTCLNDPYYGTGPYTGCKPALQYYSYNIDPQRWSNELRLSSKAGGRFHWLAGLYWERTTDTNYNDTYYMPGLQYQGAAFQAALASYDLTQRTLAAGSLVHLHRELRLPADHRVREHQFRRHRQAQRRSGRGAFSRRRAYDTPILASLMPPTLRAIHRPLPHKVDGKAGVSYRFTDHVMMYADWAQGFRPGGSNSGLPGSVPVAATPTAERPATLYTPDTLNNYEIGWKTTSLENRLLWNGAAYYMDWKDLQALIYNALVCPSSSYNINVGQARIYGAESNIDYRITTT